MQKDFPKRNFHPRLNCTKKRFRLMIAGEAEENVLRHCYVRVWWVILKMQIHAVRTLKIILTRFNLITFSDEASYRAFRSCCKDLGPLVRVCGWESRETKRNWHIADPVTAVFVVMRKLSTPTAWKDVETPSKLHYSAISEVFYGVMEYLVENHGERQKRFWKDLTRSRAARFEKAIHDCNVSLDSCFGFINCTRIQIPLPGGHGTLQQATYSDHKRIHCLIYQTVTTPNKLLF